MNRYLKCYQVTMRTLAPIFIGSGKEIGKKEYVFLNQRKVGIPDIQKMYGWLCHKGKQAAFEDYLLGNQPMDFTGWLKRQGLKMEEVKPFIKYTLDCSDAIMEGEAKRLQIMECVKDAYGSPYVPGSSLKGMLRTVLLGADVINMPRKYQDIKQRLGRSTSIRTSRTNYLKREVNELETVAYRTLQREKTKPQDAVNDVLQGLIVSDGEPLSVADLVLCQKVDVHVGGGEKTLPLLRECIKPNTEIRFTITIDTQLCPFTEKDIWDSIKIFMESYCANFLSAFAKAERPKERDIFLGGGCGFVSKTVIYPLYGKQEGISAASRIFENSGVPKVHKHFLDKKYGMSPHTMKCTKYQGKTYQMGLCRVEKMELV